MKSDWMQHSPRQPNSSATNQEITSLLRKPEVLLYLQQPATSTFPNTNGDDTPHHIPWRSTLMSSSYQNFMLRILTLRHSKNYGLHLERSVTPLQHYVTTTKTTTCTSLGPNKHVWALLSKFKIYTGAWHRHPMTTAESLSLISQSDTHNYVNPCVPRD